MIPALPALAAPTVSAELHEDAEVLAKGAAATLAIDYTCPEGAFYFGALEVSQKVGRRLARGSQDFAGNCDGTQHTLSVTITPYNDSPFRKGVAYARGYFDACGESECGPTVWFSQVVTLKKA